MKKKFKQNAIILIMICALIGGIGTSSAYASESEGDKNEPQAPMYTYSIHSKKYVGDTHKNAKKEYIKKHVATRKGEKISAGHTVEKSGSISGTLWVSHSKLKAKLGFDYRVVKKTHSSSLSAGAKRRGEVIRAYGQETYAKYKVVQKKTWYAHLHRKPEYKTIYVYKPILPTISFTYKNK